ncbi:glycosyltransferase family 2 protein [uncultured Christiangramia sp.]|uniref:glycosyltransferase family 2 protein n=1 Tax=uncultured Christiangramia sp. TaxID=503836 RepID=UPI00262B55CE|nr:glycosyltransferase family 2 protein [uncultured Christiangramia sp.]
MLCYVMTIVMIISYFAVGFEMTLIITLSLLSLLMLVESIARIRFCRRQNKISSKSSRLQKSPRVSIHIAICNEPSELVIKTIRAALQLNYENYEIVVLDNNTSDKKLWKPVREFCNRYPEKVIFKHFDKLDGYKAGALNQCLKLMHPATEYIFTVDADYILKPDSLCKAVAVIDGTDAAVVQFPQHYTLHHERHGLFNELEHFFSGYAQAGNRSLSTLPTGTLSMVRVESLLSVSGWPTDSLTEDAHLGIKFLSEKFTTYFSNQILGQGVMPGSIADLRKQRHRWVYGNTQCFLKFCSLRVQDQCKLSVFMQLSAWVNLLSFPIVFSLIYILAEIFTGWQISDWIPMLILSQFSIYVFGKLFLFLSNSKNTFQYNFKAFLIHLALSFEMAFSPIMALIGMPASFVTTSKFASVSSLKHIPLRIPTLLFMMTMLLFAVGKTGIAMYSLQVSLLFLLSGIYLYSEFAPKSINQLKILPDENSHSRA